MEVQWMNHTGFVVSDMERSLAFYRDLLGLSVERDQILEGDFISEVVGYPEARLHIVYLGMGDLRHSVELIQYLNPPGHAVALPQRHQVGASPPGRNRGRRGRLLPRTVGEGRRFRQPAGHPPPTRCTRQPARAAICRTPTATGWNCWNVAQHHQTPRQYKPLIFKPGLRGPRLHAAPEGQRATWER